MTVNLDAQRLVTSLLTHTREGIVITDVEANIVEVNNAFGELTGYSRAEVIGRNPRFLQSGHHSPEFYVELWKTLLEQGYWQGELRNRRKDGRMLAERMSLAAITDAHGATTHYLGIFSCIAASENNERHLQQIAYHDALTGLPNRLLLLDRLENAVARADRQNSLLAACYLDLDGFKPVNDLLGHAAGDQLLTMVAERLHHCARASDTVARLGGDEFVVLLSGLTRVEECEPMIQRLLSVLAAPYRVSDQTCEVTASIGVALYPLDGSDADTLLRHADQAMYLAKQAGRNRHVLFDAEHDRQVRAHRQQLSRIEAALIAHEFCLYFQPKVDLYQGVVIGAEALVRWQHPEQGLLPPSAFLPVIENHLLMVKLDHWVFAETLNQMERWQMQGLPLAISINISATTLQQTGFPDWLAEQLAEHPRIPPRFIELEIVETAALDDLKHALQAIERCIQLGVSFALDDFGTGYSSLAYFRRFPVRTLKIDQSFVRDMLVDTEDMAIVESVVNLAQAFQRMVIAEGMETALHGAALLRLGCHCAQGYGIARPMPAEALPDWVRAFKRHPLWSASTEPETLPLLRVESEHRTLARQVDDFLQGVFTHTPVVGDERACRLGRWCTLQGRSLYGRLSLFQSIELLHHRFHALAQELIDLHELDSKLSTKRIPELYAVCDTLIEQLYRLQQELSTNLIRS
ncbi:MAG: EAL domain-containing protein [Gammaproteobacteria bacterium]|nr:EAL domain-containing protein [Gammaproteobacteria bacterium]MCP5195364.1 EAL domain-containing protein [Gammaproteobacteria bacterium]